MLIKQFQLWWQSKQGRLSRLFPDLLEEFADSLIRY